MHKLLFLFIFLPAGLFAQFDTYLAALPEITSDPAQRKVSKVGNKYKISEFFPSGKRSAVYYQDRIEAIETFEYANEGTEFYENGQVRRSKIVEGKRTVLLENFLDGKPFRASVINGGEVEISTIYDLAGSVLVADGAGIAVELVRYGSAALLEKGEYKDGKRVGQWENFQNRLFSKERYKKGQLIEGTSFTADGLEIAYTEKFKPAYFRDDQEKLANGIVAAAAKVESVKLKDLMVVVDLQISSSGDIQSYSIMNKVEEPVVLLMELVIAAEFFQWQPAFLAGQPVGSSYRFKYTNVIH